MASTITPEQYERVAFERELDLLRTDTEARLNDFREANLIQHIIAIIGDSESEGSKAVRNKVLIDDFMSSLSDPGSYAIQTGGTEGGVPEIATMLAREHGIPTVGIYPAKGRKYALSGKLDFALEVPRPLIGEGNFGSETPTFVNLAAGAIVLGGEFGTQIEVATILKTNKSKFKKDQPPIYLCPVAGTGGVAEATYDAHKIADVYDALPELPVTDGEGAAKFINDKLPVYT
jgi:predicted Rossmann-fold nucleotide-binding protein